MRFAPLFLERLNLMPTFLLSNWKAIVISIAFVAYSAFIYYEGKAQCNLEHKAADDARAKQYTVDLQTAIDHHVAQENALQSQANKALNDLTTLKQAQATLRKNGENSIAKNSIYRSCVLPPDGVRIITDHY